MLKSQAKMIDGLGTSDTDADDEAMKEAYRNDIVRTRLLCRKKPNMRLLEVHYSQTVDDPAGTAKVVNEFLGGRLDMDSMMAAVDGSLYRNRAQS